MFFSVLLLTEWDWVSVFFLYYFFISILVRIHPDESSSFILKTAFFPLLIYFYVFIEESIKCTQM